MLGEGGSDNGILLFVSFGGSIASVVVAAAAASGDDGDDDDCDLE